MATEIRPELSEKNPYWIGKHRYYELKHFCLQYPIWKKAYNALLGLSSRPNDLDKTTFRYAFISDTIYAPNNSTTRAQLWTILARQNDADLTGGSIWYEKAQNWAKDKGISDGADPNAAINRGQIATFLYNHTARQGAL